jgi:hypothetical protein
VGGVVGEKEKKERKKERKKKSVKPKGFWGFPNFFVC